MMGPVLYCGDPHGQFHHIIDAAAMTKACAVVLLGDLEPQQPLHMALALLVEREVAVHFIHGNHDADTDAGWLRVWDSDLGDCNVHGRVVTLPSRQRLAGLGGVFRETAWHPTASAARQGAPAFRTMKEHAEATPQQQRCRQTGPPRMHWGTIYPQTVDLLADLRADVLVTHEAPSYHPNGFELIDTLAQIMGVKVVVNGHHHDRIDSTALWAAQGFKSFGVGLRGISAIDAGGNVEIVVPGERDDQRAHR